MSRFLLALVLVVMPLITEALPFKTKIETINGFEVHLVDVGRGDTLGIGFLTPFGSMQDQFRMMGRAHFLEHFLHNGTKAFPGYNTFEEVMKPLGVFTNAFTGVDRTYYFAISKHQHAAKLLPMYLSMLGGLEWNPESFKMQIGAVYNEIVNEGLPTESDALHLMPLTHLLPQGHPWSEVPLLGDGDSLPALTIDDMKDLYYRAYGPEFVKLVVAGNFSKPENLEEVRRLLGAHLKAADPQQDGFKPRGPGVAKDPVPGIAGSAAKRLVIHSEALKAGQIFLEAESNKTNHTVSAAGLLSSALSLDVPGTLMHTLKNELEWVTGAYARETNFRNRVFLQFYYQMTDEGLKHQTEIEKLFFTALRDVAVNGISPELLAGLKRLTMKSVEMRSHDASSVIDLYDGVLIDDGDMDAQLAAFMGVKGEDVRRLAGLFSADNALYTTMGPSGDGMTLDPRFKRGFKISDQSQALAEYRRILSKPPAREFKITPKPVDLGQLEPGNQMSMFTQTHPMPDLRVRLAIDFRKDLPDTVAGVKLHLHPARAQDLLSIDLVISAFYERYAGELVALRMDQGVELGVSRDVHSLEFMARGNDRYSARALMWALERFNEFRPSAAELERAQKKIATSLQMKYLNDMPARLVNNLAMASIDPWRPSVIDQREAVLAADTANLGNSWRGLIGRSNKELVMVGDLTESDGLKIQAAVRGLSPEFLTEKETAGLSERFQWRPETLVRPFPAARNSDGLGITRIYLGPSLLDAKELASFQALGSLLNTKIYVLNREIRKLGYVHQAAVLPLDRRHSYLFLYGQTDGDAANIRRTIEGWHEILNDLSSQRIGDGDIGAAIQDVVSRLTMQKTTAIQFAASYQTGLANQFDARFERRLAEAAKNLRPADVRAAAAKYLFDPAVSYSQLTLGDCESLLN